MSTLQQPPAPPRKKPGVEYVEYDKYIDRQVERTRKAVKLIDLAQALLVLVIGVVGFLLTAAVIEHWIFTGGLGTIGRFALFVVMAGSLGYYAVRYVWPLITSSINPAYAAAAIEREHPALKNSLLNFLLFRSHKKEMPAAVYEALEQQAAQRLSQTSIEDSIDRSALVKLGYVLLAVVVFATLYAMLSPKSSFTTAARVLMPWANIAAPSRVRIDDIKPGDVEIVEGDKVEITAQVTGLSEGELVEVSYDTADGHRIDQRVAMQPANNAGKFVVTLPPPGDLSGLSGIDQDLRYRITAGDGRTIDYNIHVLTAPSIRVENVHFDFPDYTGFADVTIDGRGDIRALEGTKVTIQATANTEIEAAFLDLASDGRNDARMKHEGSKAQVDVDLRLEDRRAIKTTSYMLRYTSTEGLANNQPPQHSLEIVPDYAPEVSVLAPEERAKDVQMNETVPITVDALDPDFALRTVTLKFAKEDGTAVHDELLVDRAHKGRFQKDWNFTPVELKLQPGDIVEYWAEATDIRTPQANRTASDRKQFRIVGDPKQGQGQQGKGQGQPQEQEGENGEQGQAGENGAQGEQGQAGENGQQGEKGQQGENGAQGEQGEQGENGQEGGEQGQQGGEQGQGNQQGENAQNGEGESNQQGAGAAGEQQQGGEGMNEGEQQGAGGAGTEQQPNGESQDGASGEQGQNGAGGGQQNPGEQGSQQGENGEGSDQQSGEGNQGGEQSSRPVANDGSDDASAFEKIQRQLSQEEQQNATRQQKEGTADPNGKMEQGNPQDAQQGERSDQASGRREASGDQRQASGDEKGESGKPSEGNPQGQGEKASSNEAGNKQAGEQAQKGEQKQPDGQEGSDAERQAEGAGADAKTDAPQSEGGKPNESQPDSASQSAGGEERNASGEPGAGEDTESGATPDAQREMQQRAKTPDQSEGGNENKSEPSTPGHSKHESDSRGEQGGDRAGGGDEGGGQKAPREGTGSAGQNQAADEGAGQSADQGPGETGTRGGDSQKAEGKTGQSGNEKGNGSESRQGQGEQQGQGQPQDQQQGAQQQAGQPQGEQQQGMQQGEKGEQGEQQGQKQGQQQGNETEAEGEQAKQGEPGNQGQPGKNEQQQNQQNQEQSEQSANNSASQGGQPGGNDGTAPGKPQGAFDGKLAEGDKANLDYTRQQTNMVLEKLADQLDKNEVDQKMLDELGWSEEDLRQFVDRWNKLRAAAEKPNATEAQQELDARLRSLGGSLGIKGGTTKRTEDDFRNLSEGYQNKVPLKYRDRLKAYTEGVSRGAEE